MQPLMLSDNSVGQVYTPLLRSTGVARSLSGAELYFKLESCQPSGSYKDRFIAAEIADLIESGGRACIATSSGNTGSALAAACARYQLRCVILVNENAPSGKLVQMQAHGAQVVRVPGFAHSAEVTERVFSDLRTFSTNHNTRLVVSAYRYCPVGMAGVESISSELSAQLDTIEHVFVPAGGGGLYSAVVRGFQKASQKPRVHLVQPEGCPTVLNAYRSGATTVEPVQSTTTISGLSVPFDIDASLALSLLRACNGLAIGVSDAEVFAAQELLLRNEGIYAEPAGATALAGYLSAVSSGAVTPAARAVCLVTGHGFKDPDAAQYAASKTASLTMEPGRILAELPNLVGVS